MSARFVTLALPLVAAFACSANSAPPRGQLLLFVDTDAPVPYRELQPDDPLRPAPLFDRLRVEVYGPSDTAPCPTCANEFALDHESLAAAQVSFGIVLATGTAGYRARLRMYHARFSSGGSVPPSVTVDRWVALPPQVADTVTAVHVSLSVDDVGKVADAQDALVTSPGKPVGSLVGTWLGAQRSPCAATPDPTRVCVPGGAYWAGSMDAYPVTGHSPDWHRLIVLSPYWLDAREVTAGEYRALGGFADQWTGSSSGSSIYDWCTLGAAKGPRDALPINCLFWTNAVDFCKARHGALPTLAQFQYAATGLGRAPFMWGYDEPGCGDAVWGRGGYGVEAGNLNNACLGASLALKPMGGVEVGGYGTLDRLSLFGVDAVDLGGNVAEYMADAYVGEDASCWQAAVVTDPLCVVPGQPSPDLVTVAGGSWRGAASSLRGDGRLARGFSETPSSVGFRCAYRDP